MSLLPILHYPDPRLHKVAQPVARVDERIRKLIRDMGETMYAAPGIGLAATQVDVHERVIVIDISDARDELRAFVNPQIIEAAGEAETEEGCLSVPDLYEEVERPAQVRVRYLDYHGKAQEIDCEGMLAVCIQHEMDHLEGTLFIDHLSRLKREMMLRKLAKARKAAEREAVD